MLTGLLLATLTAFGADCPSSLRAEQVGGSVEESMLAYATLDEEGFREAAAQAQAGLPCVSDLFTPTRVAGYHRMVGLLAFIDGDPISAQKSFAAAVAIEPDYALSAKIAPEGGKLWRSYDGSRALPRAAPAAFPAPRGAKTYVDGTLGTERVPDLPAIIQVLEGTTATTTLYLTAGAPIPELTAAALVAEAPLDLEAPLDEPDKPVKAPREPKESGGGKGGLYVAAGGGAALAGGLFVTSMVTRASFDQDPTAGKFYVTNGAFFGSIGAAALSVGLVGLAVGGTF